MLRQLFTWAEDAYPLPCESELSKNSLAAAVPWKASKPAKGGHPQGDITNILLVTFLKFVSPFSSDADMGSGTNSTSKSQQEALKTFADSLVTQHGIKGLESHVTSVVAKETKEGNAVLFKLVLNLRTPLRQYFDLFEHILAAEKAERLESKAPKGPMVRSLESQVKW